MSEVNNSYNIEQIIKENERLRKAVSELSILNEISTAISSTLSLDKIINLIVWKCIKHLKVEQAAVMLLDESKSDKPFQTMIREADSQTKSFLPLRLDSQITGWILKNRKSLLVNDIRADERFRWSFIKSMPIKSFLSVPLISKGSIIGIITLFNKKGDSEFTDNDQRLLSIIATQSTQTIENARLLEEEKELLHLQKELQMAAEIQKNILPMKIPQIDGYEIAAINIPAKEVGGDYYDFLLLNNKELIFCLGDITGKGIPAAMLMSNLQATFRSQAQIQQTLKEVISSSNTLLHKSTESDKFATFFSGVLNFEKHSLTYCNAGHDNPIHITQNGYIGRLSEGGVILGFMDDVPYDEEKLLLQKGDKIIVYTDGITETMNSDEELFGEERLIKLVSDSRDLSAKQLLEKIVDETEKFAEGESQYDDKTLLIIQREK